MEMKIRKHLIKRRWDRALSTVKVHVRFTRRMRALRAAIMFQKIVRRAVIYLSVR